MWKCTAFVVFVYLFEFTNALLINQFVIYRSDDVIWVLVAALKNPQSATGEILSHLRMTAPLQKEPKDALPPFSREVAGRSLTEDLKAKSFL